MIDYKVDHENGPFLKNIMINHIRLEERKRRPNEYF